MVPAGQLQSLLDGVDGALREHLLPAAIFGDETVFQAELERIFSRCWVFVAHESEIPNPGDYVLRRIGLDPVIVVRDENGVVNVLSNYCRHRGTEICRADYGNATQFRCPYHGWIYKINGDWLGAPNLRDAYRNLDRQKWGLLRAPKVDTHQGLIFATLSSEAPDLLEYLGGAAWMLDACLGLHPDGMRVMGPPDRWRVKTNWKVGSDNFIGDSYHAGVAHQSMAELGKMVQDANYNRLARHFDLGDGHAFTARNFGELRGAAGNFWGYPPDVVQGFKLDGLDATQRRMIEFMAPLTGTVFPNLSYTRFATPVEPGSDKKGVVTAFRQWQPIAPGRMEVWSWSLVFNFTSDEFNERCYAATANTFGSSGIFEQDDTAVWEGLPNAGTSVFFNKHGSLLNYQLGEEMSNYPLDAEWTGPGELRLTGYGEKNQRSFYRRWLQEMRQGD